MCWLCVCGIVRSLLSWIFIPVIFIDWVAVVFLVVDVIGFANTCSISWHRFRYFIPLRLIRVAMITRTENVLRPSSPIMVLFKSFIEAAWQIPGFVFLWALLTFPFAAFMTSYVGRNPRFTHAATDEGTTNEQLWGTFLRSCLSLFQVSTLDWGDISRASLEIEIGLTLVFFPYILLVGIALSNLFIGLLSKSLDNVLDVFVEMAEDVREARGRGRPAESLHHNAEMSEDEGGQRKPSSSDCSPAVLELLGDIQARLIRLEEKMAAPTNLPGLT